MNEIDIISTILIVIVVWLWVGHLNDVNSDHCGSGRHHGNG